MFHCFTSVSIVFIQGVTRSAVLAYPNGGYWLAFKIQTFDVELSFYLGLDPKELAFKHTSVVDWYTCPSKVGAFKQYIKLFCWCVRFLQLSLQVRGADIYPPDLCTEKRCSPTDLRSGQAANQMPNCTMVSPAPRAIVAAPLLFYAMLLS